MLKDWIQDQFPDKTVVYRGKEFRFHSDIPIDAMEEIADSQSIQGVPRIKLMLKLLSIDPKITDADLEVMPSTMLMALWNGLFPKNVTPTSPPQNIKNISSAQL